MVKSEKETSCCAPAWTSQRHVGTQPFERASLRGVPQLNTVTVPGSNRPILGTKAPRIKDDGEELRRTKALKSFDITETTITNRNFSEFVDATGYVTEAEQIGWSFVFWSDVPTAIQNTQAVPGVEWWRRVDGANWRDINGPGTFGEIWHEEHPVTQVSWNDAKAYARWAGGRLPTEAEWEHAARGGLLDVPYPWGDCEPNDTDFHPCNIWQGQFPASNSGMDGYLATAPAKSFDPNGYGLFNVVGNVWEWTADTFRIKSLKKSAKQKMLSMPGFKVTKGGSFLCHHSYCWRYRIAARSANSPDSATPHMGFRLVFDVTP